MKERISTLDQVRPREFNGIASETKILTSNLKSRRCDVLNAVDDFMYIGGSRQPIDGIMELFSSYITVCGYLEGLKDRTDCEVDGLDAIDHLPTFADLGGIVFALKELFAFLGAAGESYDRATHSERGLQLIQGLGTQSDGVPMADYLDVCEKLADAYATIAGCKTE